MTPPLSPLSQAEAAGGDSTRAAESHAAEHEELSGAVGTRSLWKWSCREAGRAAAASGSVAEAAVYGAMCGDTGLMLPAAGGDWEAAAWVRFRG